MLRIVIHSILTLLFLFINGFINKIAKNDPEICPCAGGWRIVNGKFISSILFFASLVNIFIPVNIFINSIPLIGSGGILLHIILTLILAYIVNSLCRQLNEPENSECKYIEGFKYIQRIISNISISYMLISAIMISIISFYL